MRSQRRSIRVGASLAALVVIAASVVTMPSPPSAAPRFSFTRVDYPINTLVSGVSTSYGVDSVAVGDLDGKNGPDIVALSAYGSISLVYVYLNNGDGTFAAPVTFETCAFAHDIVIGQFNPATDTNLDVAMTCGGDTTIIGRMLGDGAGNLDAVQTVDVGYTGAAAGTGTLAAIIYGLRLGAMNGPTLVYVGYIAGLGTTLCFLEVFHLAGFLDRGIPNPPVCNVHVNDIVGNPNFGQIDDWGPVDGGFVLGEYTPTREEPFPRDEAVGGGNGHISVTGYNPQFAPILWAYGVRNSVTTGSAVALADVDGDGQNDVLMGGDGTIAMYVPGFPIDPGATPTASFPSIPGIVNLVTADFDRDGKTDIAALGDLDPNSSDDSDLHVAIHAGNGDGTFEAPEAFATKASISTIKQQILVADFNRDGKPDLVTVGGFNAAYVSVLLNTSATGPTSPPPTISSFSPTTGVPGTIVTIHGTRLYLASSVKFGGEPALIVSDTPTILKVRVPSGALSGTIAVATQGGTATSAGSFTAKPAPVPVVTGFTPASGVVGTTVTIHGSGLLLPSVKFGGSFGTSATVLSYTATTVRALVPVGAAPGPIAVLTTRGTATSTASFAVTASPVPTVSTFSPTSGVIGTTVTIHGSGLLGTSSVNVGGVAAAIVSNTATVVKVVVPAGASSGTIALTTPGGTATSAASFTVNPSPVPSVSAFSPASGVPGATVSVFGSGLLGASSVTFGGVDAPIVSNTATSVKTLVPVGAVTGTIAVTTPSGTATSAGTFTRN